MDYLDRIPDKEYQDKLEAFLTALAQAREEKAKAKAKAQELMEKLIAESGYNVLKEQITFWDVQEQMFYNGATKLALEMEKDGQSLPTSVKVKNFTEAHIEDEKKAREWCLENFTPALTLDKKVFEKAIKDGSIPSELGTVSVVKRAQVASDLSEYS